MDDRVEAVQQPGNIDGHSAVRHTAGRRTAFGRLLLPTVGVLVVYALTLAWMPRGGFWICDNGAKFMQMQAAIRSDYQDYFIPWAGSEFDPLFAARPLADRFGVVVDGHLYCVYSPVFAVVSSIPYRQLGTVGLYVLPLLAGVLILPACSLICRLLRAPPAARIVAPLLVGLTTPLWFYSVTFWEHTPAVCLSTWSVYFCLRYLKAQGWRFLLAAAVACGGAIWFRDELSIFAVALVVVLVLYARRRIVGPAVFLVGLAVTLTPLLVFQNWALGNPLGLHFATHDPLTGGIEAYLRGRWSVFQGLLFNGHATLWISIAIGAPGLLLWSVFPRVGGRGYRWCVPLVAVVAIACGLVVLVGQLMSDSPIRQLLVTNGLLAAAPVLLLAFIRARKRAKDGVDTGSRPDARMERALWLIITVFVVLYVAVLPEAIARGIHWGCRFLLPAYPLLGVLAAVTITRWWRAHASEMRSARALVAAAVAVTLAAQAHSLRLLHDQKAFNHRLAQAVGRRSEQMVLTNVWYLPMVLAQCEGDRTFFANRDQYVLGMIVRRMELTGHRQILVIADRRDRRDASTRNTVLDDEYLNFTAVELVPMPLGQ